MRTLEERFWSKVRILGPDDCWEWQRYRTADGYGRFKAVAGQSPQRASRFAFALALGDPGMFCVLHRCDNPPCCNPAHLFLGTPADNVADMIAKGRQSPPVGQSYESRVAGVRRLTDAEMRIARRAHARGQSCRSIARSLGVAHTTISRLVNETHWRGYAA